MGELLGGRRNNANEFISLQHRHAEYVRYAAKCDGRDDNWVALDIASFRYVSDLDGLLCVTRTPKGWCWEEDAGTPTRLLIGGWRVVHGSSAKAIALAKVKRRIWPRRCAWRSPHRCKNVLKVAGGA